AASESAYSCFSRVVAVGAAAAFLWLRTLSHSRESSDGAAPQPSTNNTRTAAARRIARQVSTWSYNRDRLRQARQAIAAGGFMAVRGEEVASSIEAHVRDAIEKMVSEIRSSVDDVRVTVDSQLKAALQSVQADVNSITFLPHINKSIAELEQSILADVPAPAAAAPAAAPSGAANASQLKRAVQAVERGKSQVDILNAFLEQCLEFGSRAAL